MSYLEILTAPRTENERRQEEERYRAACQRAAGGPECAPWCVFHDGPVCYSTPAGPGSDDVTVTHDPAYGDLVQWWAREEATLDEAEAFARKILDQVARARAGGAT